MLPTCQLYPCSMFRGGYVQEWVCSEVGMSHPWTYPPTTGHAHPLRHTHPWTYLPSNIPTPGHTHPSTRRDLGQNIKDIIYWTNKGKKYRTRMHSSRMHAAHLPTVPMQWVPLGVHFQGVSTHPLDIPTPGNIHPLLEIPTPVHTHFVNIPTREHTHPWTYPPTTGHTHPLRHTHPWTYPPLDIPTLGHTYPQTYPPPGHTHACTGRDLGPEIPTPEKEHGTSIPTPHPREQNDWEMPVKTLPSQNYCFRQ